MHNLGKAKGHYVHWCGSVVKQLIILPTAKEYFFPFEDFYSIYSRFMEYVVVHQLIFKTYIAIHLLKNGQGTGLLYCL